MGVMDNIQLAFVNWAIIPILKMGSFSIVDFIEIVPALLVSGNNRGGKKKFAP